jgi:hypothetical protein
VCFSFKNRFQIAFQEYFALGQALNRALLDESRAEANIAHMAALAPRWFRAEFPAMFEQVFKLECQAAYDQLEAETKAASTKSYRGQIIAKRAAAVAVGTGVGAAMAVGMVLMGLKGSGSYAARQAVMEAAKPIWNSATREKAEAAYLARIRSRFEERLDEECQVIARKLL